MFSATAKRDARLVVRRLGEISHPVIFFVIVVSIFPFGVGSDPHSLHEWGQALFGWAHYWPRFWRLRSISI